MTTALCVSAALCPYFSRQIEDHHTMEPLSIALIYERYRVTCSLNLARHNSGVRKLWMLSVNRYQGSERATCNFHKPSCSTTPSSVGVDQSSAALAEDALAAMLTMERVAVSESLRLIGCCRFEMRHDLHLNPGTSKLPLISSETHRETPSHFARTTLPFPENIAVHVQGPR